MPEIDDLKKQIAYLEGKLSYYEEDGVGKLYHALNRKANEMAELLNRTSLLLVDIDDPKVKTFDRLQKIWSDAESISSAIKALGILSGLNNPKLRIKFVNLFPTSISEIHFDTKESSENIIVATASFRYHLFKIDRC